MADREHNDFLNISAEMAQVAMAATHQIASLSAMLRRESANEIAGSEFDDVVISITKRIRELNDVAMAVLGADPGLSLSEASEIVNG